MPAGGGRVFNPDTSVIGNFLGTCGQEPLQQINRRCNSPKPKWRFRPLSILTPRQTSFWPPDPEGLDVEEGLSRSPHFRAICS
jgi:hypothetical protein